MRKGSRRGQVRIAGAAILMLGIAAAIWYVWVWEPRSHIPSDVAYWYRRQFERGQLRPGWVLLSVGRDADRPEVLVHRVEVPSAVAGDLVMMGASEHRRLVAEIACPPAEHEVWSKLGRRHDIEVELTTDKGAFATVSCRDGVF